MDTFMNKTNMQPSWSPKTLRWSALFLGVSNVAVIIFGIILIIKGRPTCGKHDIAPFLISVLASCLRIPVMICTAIAQQAMATMILSSESEGGDVVYAAMVRQHKQKRHNRWIWCTRVAISITVIQFLDAACLLFKVTQSVYRDRPSNNCVIGLALDGTKDLLRSLFLFIFILCCAVLVQCFVGSDVLRWRSFYATECNLWKAHYQEVFDHGMREALCCLGRVETAPEVDDIYSVAQLLGDLVTYRAAGAGHLQLLAGLALLQNCRPFPELYDVSLEIPTDRLHEAAGFHQFAEAAYTGFLLDVGRNPLTFPCAWLYRQGIFSLWSRYRMPTIEGDNWWRGHAAAFLRHAKLTPDMLRKGRVNQGSCKASYFLVVAHHLKSVVIAVRGTETPEDLITDGLGRECHLSIEDLDGLINSNTLPAGKSQSSISLQPHYGHSGVVEAAQDLYMQIEGNSVHGGYLSSLLGTGCECESYNLRIVGHSLGGAIAALLGFQLYRKYPNLHVYAFGPLPCLDFIAANSCSNFVTSVILNNEFSSRLSVASIMRLRAAAINALSLERLDGSTMVSKLVSNYFSTSYFKENKVLKEQNLASRICPHLIVDSDATQHSNQITHGDGCGQGDLECCLQEMAKEEDLDYANSLTNWEAFHNNTSDISSSDHDLNLAGYRSIPEMFVPGLVIHIVPEKKTVQNPLWKRWSTWQGDCGYKAYIANRECFKDIIVSQSMFLDHLPWRCYSALEEVLKAENF